MKERQIAIVDMKIERALIAQAQGPQYLHVSAEIEWLENKVSCCFYSVEVSISLIPLVQLFADGSRLIKRQRRIMQAVKSFFQNRLSPSGWRITRQNHDTR